MSDPIIILDKNLPRDAILINPNYLGFKVVNKTGKLITIQVEKDNWGNIIQLTINHE